jgi:phosphoserine phosphatase|tara:strand:- start:29605 stop:30606 length:1002 start_codon:yes stop_codon:yes gene_type:complete
MFSSKSVLTTCLVVLFICTSACASEKPVMTAWQDNDSSQRLKAFVTSVSDKSSDKFVAPADRIAVFDNDGTLWAEQPAYFQLYFAFDQIKAIAAVDPALAQQWQHNPLYKAALDSDLNTAAGYGEKGLLELVATSHSGMTSDQFEQSVSDWISTATHPTTGKLYTKMVYQPMLELLDHLRANDFRIYIVSGGGIDFIRPWAEEVYGIPKENVIGSRISVAYDYIDGEPVIMRKPALDFIDDKAGKPVAIHQFIGKRPILAVGNSDGDLQMLEWTATNTKPSLNVYIHHTDAEREWAYDSASHIGMLKQGLIDAKKNNWLVIDMKNDWRKVFPN